MKKKKQVLGKRIGSYRESRLAIPFLIFVIMICGILFSLQNNMGTQQEIISTLTNIGLFFTLPTLVIGGVIWFLIERFIPRKTLILYQGGIQFSSGRKLETYPWKAIPNVVMTIVKSEDTGKILYHSYKFTKIKDKKTISFMSKSYSGLDKSSFNQLLKHAHVKGVLNVDTQIQWQASSDNIGYDTGD